MPVVTNSIRLASILGTRVVRRIPFFVKFPDYVGIFIPRFSPPIHSIETGQIIGHVTRVLNGDQYLLIGTVVKLGYANENAMTIQWPKSIYVVPLRRANQEKYTHVEFNFSPSDIDCLFTPFKETEK